MLAHRNQGGFCELFLRGLNAGKINIELENSIEKLRTFAVILFGAKWKFADRVGLAANSRGSWSKVC